MRGFTRKAQILAHEEKKSRSGIIRRTRFLGGIGLGPESLPLAWFTVTVFFAPSGAPLGRLACKGASGLNRIPSCNALESYDVHLHVRSFFAWGGRSPTRRIEDGSRRSPKVGTFYLGWMYYVRQH